MPREGDGGGAAGGQPLRGLQLVPGLRLGLRARGRKGIGKRRGGEAESLTGREGGAFAPRPGALHIATAARPRLAPWMGYGWSI